MFCLRRGSTRHLLQRKTGHFSVEFGDQQETPKQTFDYTVSLLMIKGAWPCVDMSGGSVGGGGSCGDAVAGERPGTPGDAGTQAVAALPSEYLEHLFWQP